MSETQVAAKKERKVVTLKDKLAALDKSRKVHLDKLAVLDEKKAKLVADARAKAAALLNDAGASAATPEPTE